VSPSGRTARAWIAAVLVAQVGWGLLYIHRTSFERSGERVFCLWDDAMISMRYARNWADGWGPVWNPGGEPVWGFSNPGVTLVMAGLHALPLAPTRVSLAFQLLNLAALCAALLLLRRVALRATGDDAVALGGVVGCALCAPLQIWSLQGADTGFMALWLLVALAWLAAAGGSWPRGLFAWLAAGVWIRPDAGLFAAGFVAASAAFGPGALRRVLTGGALLAAAALALALFGVLVYGDPLPNTFYLKATGAPHDRMLRAGLLELLYWPLGLVTGLPLAVAALLRFRRGHLLALSAALVVLALLFYDAIFGGDWKGEYGNRFVAPVLPLLVLLGAAGARALADVAFAGTGHRLRAAAVVALSAALGLLASPRMALVDWFDPRAAPMLKAQNESNFDRAVYLRDHTRPTATLAVHYGGVPPYFAERRAVDVLGKSDRHIARLEVDRFLPGHSKWDWPYILHERHPDIFLAASRGLAMRPDFLHRYYLARVPAQDLRFFVRREALGVLTDPDIQLFDPATGRAVRTRDALDPRHRGVAAR
jgi:hypothetical protein